MFILSFWDTPRGTFVCAGTGVLAYSLLSYLQIPFPEHLTFPTGRHGFVCRRAVLGCVDTGDIARLASTQGDWAAQGRVNTPILGSIQADTEYTVLTFLVL